VAEEFRDKTQNKDPMDALKCIQGGFRWYWRKTTRHNDSRIPDKNIMLQLATNRSHLVVARENL
jgi:hypothetical protein